MAAIRRNSLMQGHVCSGCRSEQVLPPRVVRRAASERQILEVLRGRCRRSPDAAIAAAEPDHGKISVRLCCGRDAQRQQTKCNSQLLHCRLPKASYSISCHEFLTEIKRKTRKRRGQVVCRTARRLDYINASRMGADPSGLCASQSALRCRLWFIFDRVGQFYLQAHFRFTPKVNLRDCAGDKRHADRVEIGYRAMVAR